MLLSAVLLALLLVVTLVKAVQVVPEAHAGIVVRFGSYSRTLRSGLHFVVPFVDSVRHRIDLREQVVSFPPQPTFIRNGVVCTIDHCVYYEVTDPRAATYEVADHLQAIEQLSRSTLRDIVGGMDLDRLLTSRAEINAALRGVLHEAALPWGVLVHRAELKAVEPPTSVQDSLEKQLRADRDKRASILQAEAMREKALLEAETERDVAAILAHRVAATAPGSGPPVPPSPTPPPPRGQEGAPQPLREDDPRRVDRYTLTARLGEGGMGTVFLGRSPGERMVAVKVVHGRFAADPTFRERFAREIEAARRVGGFHTAAVVDADAEAESPWLVTEYIPGPSLHDVLRLHGAMPPRTLHSMALGVAEALEGIHGAGIIHRDLKPGNIIVSATGPRVIDFGIARAFDSAALTRTHMVMGSRGFLAPEQLAGAATSSATDLYAYGMVLCHAAGAAPSPDDSACRSPLELLPSTLAPLVARCLDAEPARRPTCAEVLRELTGEHAPAADDWLPPAVRTMVDLHNAPTVRPR
ncbi:SPFH domain-containing protein [Streptomyces sp. NPDC004111]|uniref:protein kinase domain-containing protein n=1 Tax=Streptomyces sp. NPDC004111 TaxID=3364690 RepID=UPI0036749E1F